MAQQWRGVVSEYRRRLPVSSEHQVVSLGEGGTPILAAKRLSALTGCEIFLKVEGSNPTGSCKDRGMSVALTLAVERGSRVVVCIAAGATSASAAAYAAAAGIGCAVLVPQEKISLSRLSQTIAYGAHVLQMPGTAADLRSVAQDLTREYPVTLIDETREARLEGQKTAAFEVVEALGYAPDIHVVPVGNAFNMVSYWRGYCEYAAPFWGVPPIAQTRPRMWGFQAALAAPLVRGLPVAEPETVATAIRVGNPVLWEEAVTVRDDSGGIIEAVSDAEILEAHRWLAAQEGVFVEPASAAGVAGILKKFRLGQLGTDRSVVITLTGHGLTDPQWALQRSDGTTVTPSPVQADARSVAQLLGLTSASSGGSYGLSERWRQ